MSKKTEGTYQWDTYVREADRPDFVLKVSDDREIRITNPSGTQIMRFSEAVRNGDADATLAALTGDAWLDIRELLETAGSKATDALIEDIMYHFDLFDEVELRGPSGGTVKESRPTKIASLLRMGYKPVGEF